MSGMLAAYAREKSVYNVTITGIVDADGQSVIPDTMTWTLLDTHGNIINEREDVSITPSPTTVITLRDNDLSFLETEGKTTPVIRILAINSVYDSSLGSGLSQRDEYLFRVSPLLYTE